MMQNTKNTHAEVQEFRTKIEGKINDVVKEFANGKLSRELFQMIYSRYSGQLSMIEKALSTGNLDMVNLGGAGEATIAIRDAYEGKARGIMIYYNRNGTVLETLGEIDAPLNVLTPVLNKFSMMMEMKQYIDHHIQKISDRRWVLMVAGQHTTIVVEFRNEPSQEQIRVIQRLHHHFEKANDGAFGRDLIDATKLAYPFTVFIEKKRAAS